MQYTKNQFVELLSTITTDPFEILEYNGTSKPGKYYCGLCQKTYSLARLGVLLKRKNHLCSHCFASQYAEQVLTILSQHEQLNFVRFGYKQNLHKPTVIYTCAQCAQETEKPLVEFIKYPTCIHCGDNAKRRNTDTLNLILPKEFELIGEYKGQYEKTLFRHSCGFIFTNRPKDIINGHSYCPKCSKKASKGERKIISYLTNNNIEFEKEKTFDWSDKKRYDFYLPQYNLLIEYQGIQHYKEVPNFFTPLEEQQKVDLWKQNEAIVRGFNYLIIPYTDFESIETILAQRLKESI